MSSLQKTPGAAGTASEGAYQGTQQQANSSATPIETLLARLDNVRRTGRYQWMACCPAHEDRRPSLAIREADDGGVLINCFSGCDALAVVNAAGLEWIDIIPIHKRRYRQNDGKASTTGPRWDYRALLRQLRYESTIVIVAANELAHLGALSDADRQRLTQAAIRIAHVAEMAK